MYGLFLHQIYKCRIFNILIRMSLIIYLSPQPTQRRLIHSCIDEVLEVLVAEIGLHKFCLLLQHCSHNGNHVIIERNLSHLTVAILHSVCKIHATRNSLRQLIYLPLHLVAVLPVYVSEQLVKVLNDG